MRHLLKAAICAAYFCVLATPVVAKAEDQALNLYTARHYQTDEALYADFTRQTGIKINRIEGGEDPLFERIKNEGANSPADVFITVDIGRLWRAEQAGIFAQVKSKTLESRIPADVQQRLGQLGVLPRVAVISTVPSESVGLLFIDGTLRQTLDAGLHAFWNFNGNVSVERVELRARSLDVSGQELLSRDKVTLRVNLAATVQVIDPVRAHRTLSNADEFVYRQLQFGLRQAIAARSLDELLGDKAALDGEIAAHVQAAIEGHGVRLLGVGIKDVILPGEMKEILNGVVLAEKQAQASVIRRREEANATRSQLNTAKLIEDNPVLMRLKELEALEKVTEKIDTLTVFGGLDGVLKQLVTIR